MRKLSDAEVLSLTGLLKMENDSLAVAKAMQTIIGDEDLKKKAESGILAMECRIKGIQQFINKNGITGEVR
jgi:phosphopantetheine adenylyltransferase